MPVSTSCTPEILYCAAGALVKGENDSRIDFLAKVRNKAMEPLWLLANKSLSDASDQASRQKPWKADRVLFMNDVFICAKDFMRLLLHDVDMACALDFGDRDKVELFPSSCHSLLSVEYDSYLYLHSLVMVCRLFVEICFSGNVIVIQKASWILCGGAEPAFLEESFLNLGSLCGSWSRVLDMPPCTLSRESPLDFRL